MRRDFFEPWEVENIVKHLPDYLQDFTRFAAISSWRRNEIATLVWEDVSFSSKIIRLNSQNNKTGDTRILPFIGEIPDILERRLQARIENCPYRLPSSG
jgi:integrase